MRSWASLILCAACGRVGFDVTNDGASAEIPPADAACAAPVPALATPPTSLFGPPSMVAELAGAGYSDDPTLTADMLEIYFESSRGGMPQIWRAERASAGVTWSPPTPVVELDGQMANTPEISRDGLTLYFSSTSGSPVPAAYVTTRPDRASPWGPPVHVSGLVIVEGISGVVPFFDDRAVIYATTAPGGPGNQDLWLALRTGSGCATFGMNAPLPGLANTVDAEFNPWVRNDGLAVAFASPRSSGTGSSDLWISTRASTASDFTASIEQATLSSPGVDDDPWLDDAMGVIYFMSTRNGTAQIYSASR